MSRGRPGISPEQIEQIKQRTEAGNSTSSIVKELGISRPTVEKYQRQLGLRKPASPEQIERMAVARESRMASLKEQRAELAQRMIDEARSLLDDIHSSKSYAQAVGGKEPCVVRWEMDEPLPADKRNLMNAATAAIDKHLKLADFDAEDTTQKAKSLVRAFADAINVSLEGTSPEQEDTASDRDNQDRGEAERDTYEDKGDEPTAQTSER